MTKDDTEIVSALHAALADKVGKDRFELWFGANTRLAIDGETLRVSVPNQFYQDWLRTHFRRHLEALCVEALGRHLPVAFHIDAHLGTSRVCEATPPACQSTKAAAPAAMVEPERLRAPRRRFASLDTFVEGMSNRIAATSAHAIVEQLGRVSPLVFFGPPGVGKTHLLEGIWTAAHAASSRANAVYLSAEQFTSYYLEALHGSGLPNFRRKYRGVDLLLVDDVQFFASKRATLVELLHTIDTLQREGRQVVLACDRPPAEMEDLGPELVTRLSAGLVCRIDPPEYETRLGIVRRLAARLEFALPGEVQTFVAANINASARELSGAVNRLHATSRALRQPITLAVAEETLAEAIRHSAKTVRLADIQRAVCNVFGLEPQSLVSTRKGRHVSQPRMLAMWLARKHTRAGLSEIGHFFGRRSHSTVISAQKKIGLWIESNAPLELPDCAWRVEDAIRRVEERLLAS